MAATRDSIRDVWGERTPYVGEGSWLVRKHGRLEPVSWDEAMGLIVDRSRSLLAAHSPGAIGFYNTGQLLLEEHYTLSIIARAGVKTTHLDGNTCSSGTGTSTGRCRWSSMTRRTHARR